LLERVGLCSCDGNRASQSEAEGGKESQRCRTSSPSPASTSRTRPASKSAPWTDLTDTIQQIAQDDGTFKRAKIVFTESDERCGLTAELDGVKKEGVPLSLDLEQLEDAKTSAGARAQLKEALRLYFRKVLGR